MVLADWNARLTDDRLDRSDQTNLVTGIFKNRFDHIGGSGLALGTGNADGFQLCRPDTRTRRLQ